LAAGIGRPGNRFSGMNGQPESWTESPDRDNPPDAQRIHLNRHREQWGLFCARGVVFPVGFPEGWSLLAFSRSALDPYSEWLNFGVPDCPVLGRKTARFSPSLMQLQVAEDERLMGQGGQFALLWRKYSVFLANKCAEGCRFSKMVRCL
jgi:hypothetical protein